eukprot:COSAG06_NODE_926_length_11497_cov_60.540216_1_plen_60_part_00
MFALHMIHFAIIFVIFIFDSFSTYNYTFHFVSIDFYNAFKSFILQSFCVFHSFIFYFYL